jgi:hypothetical protein
MGKHDRSDSSDEGATIGRSTDTCTSIQGSSAARLAHGTQARAPIQGRPLADRSHKKHKHKDKDKESKKHKKEKKEHKKEKHHHRPKDASSKEAEELKQAKRFLKERERGCDRWCIRWLDGRLLVQSARLLGGSHLRGPRARCRAPPRRRPGHWWRTGRHRGRRRRRRCRRCGRPAPGPAQQRDPDHRRRLLCSQRRVFQLVARHAAHLFQVSGRAVSSERESERAPSLVLRAAAASERGLGSLERQAASPSAGAPAGTAGPRRGAAPCTGCPT